MAIPRIVWQIAAVPEWLDDAIGIKTRRELFGGVVDLGLSCAMEQSKREEVQVLVKHLWKVPCGSL